MRARKALPWLVLPLLVMALTACAVRTSGPEPWQWQNSEVLQQQILRDGEVAAQIDLGALAFSGAAMADAVNRRLQELRQERLFQHAAYAEQLLAEAEFNGPLPQGLVYYTLEESPAVYYNDGLFLSLITDGYEYIYGTPHPLTYRYGYTFDAASGQQLTLADIWGADAKERAAAQIYRQVEREGRLDDFYPNLAENLLLYLDDEDWYMDEKNLYIIYNPYEIAAYALGIVEFALLK